MTEEFFNKARAIKYEIAESEKYIDAIKSGVISVSYAAVPFIIDRKYYREFIEVIENNINKLQKEFNEL